MDGRGKGLRGRVSARQTPTPTVGEPPSGIYGVAGAGSVSVRRGGVDRQARI